MSGSRIERALSGLLTVAAVVMAVTVTVRELRPRAVPGQAASIVSSPTYAGDWRNVAQGTILWGSSAAPVRLIEFGDMECPACRQFHAVGLPQLTAQFGEQLSVELIHFPLPGHRFAVAAARAAVCAEAQGRAPDFVKIVFERQDSIGLTSWAKFATSAGIGDTLRFNACSAADSSLAAVDSSRALGSSFGINSTPTIMVNGWIMRANPVELSRVIGALLANGNPYDDVPADRVRRVGPGDRER